MTALVLDRAGSLTKDRGGSGYTIGFAFLTMSHLRREEGKFNDDWGRDDDNEEQ